MSTPVAPSADGVNRRHEDMHQGPLTTAKATCGTIMPAKRASVAAPTPSRVTTYHWIRSPRTRLAPASDPSAMLSFIVRGSLARMPGQSWLDADVIKFASHLAVR